ncbi:uncharacterized protein AMSG_08519 [Thecamonas trahens ATCC 50062]|uniref:Uncharacterized protein n=1 Tax=Thecamonas trahens ATCC 50062 TaxID=461836 RepID=A0A0L0DKC3_THETB|nr:hypothetical protein AMSG_08519 [Thecamonas trahens ATCC 50062]KNC52650.1 hypothetical protein AMSG_08519 [Thecamonas trahens ATCC 50062]|eukprot:XP_013755201.1 hypothetical protein AMSG_08519 [Thecamonas trahens ATCC 50062]
MYAVLVRGPPYTGEDALEALADLPLSAVDQLEASHPAVQVALRIRCGARRVFLLRPAVVRATQRKAAVAAAAAALAALPQAAPAAKYLLASLPALAAAAAAADAALLRLHALLHATFASLRAALAASALLVDAARQVQAVVLSSRGDGLGRRAVDDDEGGVVGDALSRRELSLLRSAQIVICLGVYVAERGELVMAGTSAEPWPTGSGSGGIETPRASTSASGMLSGRPARGVGALQAQQLVYSSQEALLDALELVADDRPASSGDAELAQDAVRKRRPSAESGSGGGGVCGGEVKRRRLLVSAGRSLLDSSPQSPGLGSAGSPSARGVVFLGLSPAGDDDDDDGEDGGGGRVGDEPEFRPSHLSLALGATQTPTVSLAQQLAEAPPTSVLFEGRHRPLAARAEMDSAPSSAARAAGDNAGVLDGVAVPETSSGSPDVPRVLFLASDDDDDDGGGGIGAEGGGGGGRSGTQ